jgi:2-keto-4-pentenoate hydratase/2-oxohepta-3-ene-1,7-dioic acid hydratase in catechol pathway
LDTFGDAINLLKEGGSLMKYLRVISERCRQDGDYGILDGNTISLLDGCPLNGTPTETGIRFSKEEVQYFLPLVTPPNIIAIGLNYKEHAKESSMDVPVAPVIFLKATSALTGHRQPVQLPSEAPAQVDFEAELTIVIGKACKNVKEEEAREYIFGYTCGNDISARDCQLKLDKQWTRGKSFDTFAPIGPVIETDIDPHDLRIQLRLNGKTMQDGRTRDLIFPVFSLVSYLSRQMTLLPGTLIMTGTPEGIGFSRRPQVFLKPGDRMEVEIDGIGILENSVVSETIHE